MNLGIGLGLTNYLRVPTVALDPDAAIAALFESGEEGAWYDPSDSTTVFQDAAGTTPAGVGDPVGLILDKSKGATPGPELLTNGDMSSSTGWVLSSGISISSGQMLFSSAGFNAEARQPVVSSGKWYYYEVNVASITSGVLSLVIGNLTAKSQLSVGVNSGYYFLQTAQDADAGIVAKDPGGPTTAAVDYFVLKELPGNHATQTTSAARPILQQSGATPVLSGTELVTNGTFDTDTTGWTSLNSGSGTVVSQEVVVSAPNNYGGIQQPFSVIAGRRYSISVDMYADAGGSADIRVDSYFGLVTNSTSKVTKTTTFVAGYTGNMILKVYATTANINAYFDNISIQEVTSWSGGLRYLDFDGVDDSLKSSAFASAQAQPNTIAIGAQSTNITTSYFYDTDSSGDPYRHALIISTQTSVALFAGDFGYATVDAISTESVLTAYFSGTSSYLRQNGALKSTTINPDTNSWTGVTLGSRFTGIQAHLDGRIYSFVGVNRTLTAGEISDLESYLATKSGFVAPTITGVPTITVS